MNHTGKIIDIEARMGSGIATIWFADGSRVLVESGFGLRQFAAAFGSLENALGRTIAYDTDFGILGTRFEIVDEVA
jgi:L-rhamnose isomerase